MKCSLALALFLAAAPALAAPETAPVKQTRLHDLRVVTVSGGLEHPWALAFLPDGRKLVTERPGRLRVIEPDGRLDPRPVAGLPRVDAGGQGGLLDVALHPQFASNRLIYWTYARADESGARGTEVARGRLEGGPGNWRVEDAHTIFKALPKSSGGLHFGSRLVFDREGRLFVTLGERGDMARAQNPGDHAGKVLRLTDTGAPAPGNPWVTTAGAQPEVYSIGHRNPQGAALEPATGALWINEHGPQGGDELNLVRPGANYGWPVVTHGVQYVTGARIGEGTDKPGMTPPVRQWTPSPALSGLAFYSGDKFPRWQGQALMGALRGQALIRVRLEGGRVVEDETLLAGELPRVRDVRVGPDGYVYLLTDQPAGRLLRLEPAAR